MDELIAEIQNRNILWNRKHPRYKDRLAVDKEWDIVAERTGFTKVEARKKWRNLRDQFSKEIKKNSGNSQDGCLQYTGKWQYFASLMFLKDIVTSRVTKGTAVPFRYLLENSTAENGVLEGENSEDNTTFPATASSQEIIHDDILLRGINKLPNAVHCETIPSKPKPPRGKRKRVTNAEMKDQLLQIEARKLALLEVPEDENSLFLRSLLPYMKQMDPLQQLRVRAKFQEVLIQEMSLAQHKGFLFFNTYCPVEPSSATPSLRSSNHSGNTSPRSQTDSS